MAFRTAIGETTFLRKYAHERCESWPLLADTLVEDVCRDMVTQDVKDEIKLAISTFEFIPGGRYLRNAGRPLKSFSNCYALRAEEDTREDWAELSKRVELCLGSGGGIGVDYTVYRPRGSHLTRTGGIASGPISKMKITNEQGRELMQGGDRRSAIYGSLSWAHADAQELLHAKDWDTMGVPGTGLTLADVKRADFSFPAPLDHTNISLNYDDAWLALPDRNAHPTFVANVRQALKNGEPGFSFNFGAKSRETLRNACCEHVSEDDSDSCNLGSINLAEIDSVERLEVVSELASIFLMCGTVTGHAPYDKVYRVRAQNRRIGVGLMGVHEWLLQRGYRYEVVPELHHWLATWRDATTFAANRTADRLGLARPKGVRAIAPTGCQRPDTLVVTGDGILEMGEIVNQDGPTWQDLKDLQVAQDRPTTASTRRGFVNGPAATKLVTLSSGAELEATPNHQYRVLRDGEYRWTRTDEVKKGDLLVVRLGGYEKQSEPSLLSLPKQYRTEKDCTFPTSMSPPLAKFIGRFFGDGSVHEKGIRIACNAKEIEYTDVATEGEALFGFSPTLEDNGRNCMSVCFNSIPLVRWLAVNGLLKSESLTVEIPLTIRISSAESVRSFLHGYWLADGSESTVQYIDTASKKMALQTQAVLRALGTDAAVDRHASGFGTPMFRVRVVKTHRRCETPAVRESLRGLGLSDCCTVDEVESVADSTAVTLDFEVPSTMTYIANGIVSHNTIGMLAGTTTGIEPIFAVAYKRRYLVGTTWKHQYVVDSMAKTLIDSGIAPEKIESAADLAADFERRIKFQADVQDYVDMAISSTINLPQWGSEHNNEDLVPVFAATLSKYAPRLRGLTAYPDGSRGGQPLTAVPYEEARNIEGLEFEENDACVGGVCGI